MSFILKNLGETAVLLEFEQRISVAIYSQVVAVQSVLKALNVVGIEAIVPAYASVLIRYNPLVISAVELSIILQKLNDKLTEVKTEVSISQCIEIPVCYSREFAPDLDAVMQHTNLSQAELVRLHSAQKYTVFMLGFLPGFGYLGPLDSQLFCPRKTVPAATIAAGSVAIAGNQTAVYPIESPGGWHVIGRTPLQLFNPTLEDPFLLHPSDTVVFKPISDAEFYQLERQYATNQSA